MEHAVGGCPSESTIERTINMTTISKAARSAYGASLAAILTLGLLAGCSGFASGDVPGSVLPAAPAYAAPQAAGEAMSPVQASGSAMPQSPAGATPPEPADAMPQAPGNAMPQGPAGATPPPPAGVSSRASAPSTRVAHRIEKSVRRHIEQRAHVRTLQLRHSKRQLTSKRPAHQHRPNVVRRGHRGKPL